jgi:hypothetical protein
MKLKHNKEAVKRELIAQIERMTSKKTNQA